jgi:hypothetical protein
MANCTVAKRSVSAHDFCVEKIVPNLEMKESETGLLVMMEDDGHG